MRRLLAKVVGTKVEKRYRDGDGLRWARYVLRVRIEGSAVSSLAVPDRVLGKEITIKRDFLLPWGVAKGDLLVLDKGESSRVLCPRASSVRGRCLASWRTELSAGDVDGDGFDEDVFSSPFLWAVVQPHLGARLVSLVACDGRDRFARPYDHTMGGKYILLGGAEGAILEEGCPGELWKTAFDRTVSEECEGALAVRYEHALKSPEGVRFQKTVRLEPGFPGVVERYTIRYAGKAEAKSRDQAGGRAAENEGPRRDSEDGKDTARVTFEIRMLPAVVGDVGSLNTFLIPGPRGVVTVRYHRPGYGHRGRWRDWRDEHVNLRGGFLVSRHEGRGNILVVLFDPSRVGVLGIRSDYEGPRISVRHVPREIAKGGRAEFGAAFLVGHALAATGNTLLLATRGRGGPRGVPIALSVRTRARVRKLTARVATAAGRRVVRLEPRTLTGAGRVYVGTAHLSRAAFPATATVEVGGERLTVRMGSKA